MLIGREAECARVEELLDRARMGRSGALVIRGEPGIGKTALLDHAAARADGATVVRTSGIESEAELQFSGLLDVCRPLLHRLAELPANQQEALRAVFDLGPAVAADRFAVGAATLGVLAAEADVAPVLVLVDDAQWLDSSSLDALLFATRRLQADRVAVLFAVREGEGASLETRGLDSIEVRGLSLEDAGDLLQRADMAADVVERLHEATGGNPLALLELPSVLSQEQLRGEEPLADPLPAGSSVETAFARRAETLSADTRRALLFAAVSSAGSRAKSRRIRLWTRTIWIADPRTTASASQPMLTKTAAPLAATALAISANTPIGVASITNPTIFSSTADSDCSRPAKGLPASPASTVPTPTRIATKISASMSPFANASTMLSGMMPTSWS